MGQAEFNRRRFVGAAASTAALVAATTAAGTGPWGWLYASTRQPGGVDVFLTSAKHRHEQVASAVWSKAAPASVADVIAVDRAERYQPILGFGAALTDASCFLLSQMDAPRRQAFLAETYSPAQMGLNFGRAAIGASDYSRNVFNYDDVAGDTGLEHFSIAHDEAYILPMIREIHGLSPELFLLASPWSPPGWMKTYGSMLGGWMSSEYLEPYAHYIAKFIGAYAKAGIRIDAVTSQNEVETDQSGRMPATYWTPEMEEDFIRDHLGPLFAAEKIDTQIWLLDHNYELWKRVQWQLRDEKLRRYVSGVAWHGYVGTPDMMSRLHDTAPAMPFYWTEGGPDVTSPHYATEWANWGRIFTGVLNNWCRGILTWNLMLDEKGEPNIGPFRCGGLVTLKRDGSIETSGQYWALRHLSQHVRRGAVRVASHSDSSELFHVALENPDGSTSLLLTNTGEARSVAINRDGQSAVVELPADSVATLVW